MNDADLHFGLVTLGSSSAVGYSANCVDFRVEIEDLANLQDAVLVIVADGAVSAADISLFSGSTDNPTTSIRDYPQIASMADGERKELDLPLTCSRYLRVGGEGTGKITAWIEIGGKSAG